MRSEALLGDAKAGPDAGDAADAAEEDRLESDSWPAPHIIGTKPPTIIPKVAHIAITPRPMRN